MKKIFIFLFSMCISLTLIACNKSIVVDVTSQYYGILNNLSNSNISIVIYSDNTECITFNGSYYEYVSVVDDSTEQFIDKTYVTVLEDEDIVVSITQSINGISGFELEESYHSYESSNFLYRDLFLSYLDIFKSEFSLVSSNGNDYLLLGHDSTILFDGSFVYVLTGDISEFNIDYKFEILFNDEDEKTIDDLLSVYYEDSISDLSRYDVFSNDSLNLGNKDCVALKIYNDNDSVNLFSGNFFASESLLISVISTGYFEFDFLSNKKSKFSYFNSNSVLYCSFEEDYLSDGYVIDYFDFIMLCSEYSTGSTISYSDLSDELKLYLSIFIDEPSIRINSNSIVINSSNGNVIIDIINIDFTINDFKSDYSKFVNGILRTLVL